jgi:hypothetical protein
MRPPGVILPLLPEYRLMRTFTPLTAAASVLVLAIGSVACSAESPTASSTAPVGPRLNGGLGFGSGNVVASGGVTFGSGNVVASGGSIFGSGNAVTGDDDSVAADSVSATAQRGITFGSGN